MNSITTNVQNDIVGKLNVRKSRLLLVLQACIGQQHQFEAVRKILLDELGNNGFQKELEDALTAMERQGTGGHTHAKKGGAL